MNLDELRKWACNILKTVLQAKAPYDTGNLSIHSIRIDSDGNGVFIGGEIAPYAVYTNEAWLSDKSNGKKNPNEGWIGKAIREAEPILKQALSGKMTREEYEEAMKKYELEKDRRAEHLAKVLAERRDNI